MSNPDRMSPENLAPHLQKYRFGHVEMLEKEKKKAEEKGGKEAVIELEQKLEKGGERIKTERQEEAAEDARRKLSEELETAAKRKQTA